MIAPEGRPYYPGPVAGRRRDDDAGRHPPTMRVRVRAKNPRIGRAPDGAIGDGPMEDAPTRIDPNLLPPTAPLPVAELMDDDATEIATSPPPRTHLLLGDAEDARFEPVVETVPTRPRTPPAPSPSARGRRPRSADRAPEAAPSADEATARARRPEARGDARGEGRGERRAEPRVGLPPAEPTPSRARRPEPPPPERRPEPTPGRSEAPRPIPPQATTSGRSRAPRVAVPRATAPAGADPVAVGPSPGAPSPRGPGAPRTGAPRKSPTVLRGVAQRGPARGAVPPLAVTPRQRIELRGTKAAGAMAARLKVERIEREQPSTEFPELRLTRGLMPRACTEVLSEVLSGAREERDLRGAAHSPKRALERLIHAAELQKLDMPERARLLEGIATTDVDIDSITAALRLLQSGLLEQTSAGERRMALDVFAHATPTLRLQLATAAARALHGRPALLDRDVEDTPLLAHLVALAGSRRLPAALERGGLTSEHVLAMVLSSLARPPSLPLEGGGDGVLGLLEFGLADASPAELCRLWRGLVGAELTATLPDGQALELGQALQGRASPGFAGTETPMRLGLELLVGLAHPRSGPRRDAVLMPGGACVDADVVARVLGLLYGVGYTVIAGPAAIGRHLAQVSRDPERVPPVFVTWLTEGQERLFVFERLDDQGLFVRAPHGASTKPRGGRREAPARRVEEPARGVDSLALEAFETSVGVALLPRT